MKKVNYTFDLSEFIENRVPAVDKKYMIDHIHPTFLLPLGDYFGKTLYMTDTDKNEKTTLTAFRILAWAVTHDWSVRDYKFGISFYIQKPNEPAKWVDWGLLPWDLEKNYYKPEKKIFFSVADYISHVNGKEVTEPIDWTRVDSVLDLEVNCSKWYELRMSYYWDGDDIKKKASRIKYITGNESGISVGLKHGSSNYYDSKEDCLASRLESMTIVEFPQQNISDNKGIMDASNGHDSSLVARINRAYEVKSYILIDIVDSLIKRDFMEFCDKVGRDPKGMSLKYRVHEYCQNVADNDDLILILSYCKM